MLRGALSELPEPEQTRWSEDALQRLAAPELREAISVSAWPALCELLGCLPEGITQQQVQEMMWQQSFGENMFRIPLHQRFQRYARLAAQLAAIGMELDSERVEDLSFQITRLDRHWKERLDLLTHVVGAASAVARKKVKLDRSGVGLRLAVLDGRASEGGGLGGQRGVATKCCDLK